MPGVSRWALPVAATAVVATGGALATQDPAKSILPCALYALTGLHCPGCGGTRAAHALLGGEVAQAFGFNPAFVLAVPVLLFVYGGWWWKAVSGDRPSAATVNISPRSVGILFVLVVAFGIARNLPWSVFRWMAP